jgi:hypothetical protein
MNTKAVIDENVVVPNIIVDCPSNYDEGYFSF